MDASNNAFQASIDLTLWFKVRDGDPLKLSDIPDIIALRWEYFRDNWEFLKDNIITKASDYYDPDFLLAQVSQFSDFITTQRNSRVNINPFADTTIFNRFYTIFDNILIETINLTNEEQSIITRRTQEVAVYSKNDFIRIRDAVTSYRDRLADLSGLGDPNYDTSYQRSAIPTRTDATIVDLNTMVTIQQNVKAVDFILANLFAVDTTIDPFALARQNANNPDVEIGQYASGQLVKMEYGESLESIASKYLGSADSWIDIAIANGLKPPYIDEVGQRLYLISNGNGNQLNIAATDVNGTLNIDKFYINQVIFLSSSVNRFPDQRTIINIRQIPVSGEIILQLSGDTNLDIYKLADQASIRLFLPNTTNSSFYILIPSTQPLANPRQEEVPWFLTNAASDEKLAKVDLAIDSSGEINFQTNGDLQLSYGLSNAIQAVRLKMMTELGSLRYHPDFGLVNILGNKNDNLNDLKSLLISSITEQIAIDSRFDRVENITVEQVTTGDSNTGVSTINIIVSVRLAGGTTVIPISFSVTK